MSRTVKATPHRHRVTEKERAMPAERRYDDESGCWLQADNVVSISEYRTRKAVRQGPIVATDLRR